MSFKSEKVTNPCRYSKVTYTSDSQTVLQLQLFPKSAAHILNRQLFVLLKYYDSQT